MRIKGTEGVKLIECINPQKNKWVIRWDVQPETEGGVSYYEYVFLKRPTLSEIKDIIINWINDSIKVEIMGGYVWREKPVWLSPENQLNYQADYLQAITTSGNSLPVKCKFGADEEPIFFTFESLEDITDFYNSYVTYIREVQNKGWDLKKNFDFSPYDV
ncbi:hypothetical protein [Parabacteroides sp. PF5-9]|uniref:hypothetical protein n=1 Tax=Parabacteroides sp. PF5-9 TaxID=1742404 RepID=UPI002474ED7F|nr:hypothetical protein [Parabacteroides sp. PF5-9]MDH6357251.1 hypothetical protein [Parabacteroides sp. PF5-9]